MKHVDIEEAVAAATLACPPKPSGEGVAKKAMTRAEKLRHWATLVRNDRSILLLYHKLEYCTLDWLKGQPIFADNQSAFAIAVRDGTLRAEGLPGTTTIYGIMQFFELTQAQLHEFSCDCGGAIDNEQMASRIEKIADGGGGPSLVRRIAPANFIMNWMPRF